MSFVIIIYNHHSSCATTGGNFYQTAIYPDILEAVKEMIFHALPILSGYTFHSAWILQKADAKLPKI